MQWTQPFPKWIRALFILFGVTTVIGALVEFSSMTLGGVGVGCIWALVGWKGVPVIQAAERPRFGTDGWWR